jgi:adenylate cyclase 10
VASVLGDIFDVQTLIKIWPFRSAIDNEALMRKLQNLEAKEILEVMDV